MATTETGIDISKYTEEKAAGSVAMFKGVGGNYVYQRVTYVVQMVNGIPTAVPSQAPQLANINRQSIADIRAALVNDEAAITAKRVQLDAIEADMNALDAAVVLA